MNDTSASRDAASTISAADVIRRLSEQCADSKAVMRLVEAHHEAEGHRLSASLRVATQPELQGIGITFNPNGLLSEPMDAKAEACRAKDRPDAPDDTVQSVVLHGLCANENNGPEDRAEVGENREFPTLDEFVVPVGDGRNSDETVHPLSVKYSKNNGCTAGSLSPSESASSPASRDNIFASPSPARCAHDDNELRGAPAPCSPVQEVIPCAPELAICVEEQSPPEVPLAKISLGYCRCDFFDNGPTSNANGTKSGRGRAQYKANVFLGRDKRNYERFKVAFLSEGRFFKRSIPNGHSIFYDKVWERFELLRQAVRKDTLPMDIRPVIAHLKDKDNHVVPRAAAVLFKEEGDPPLIILFLDGSTYEVDLNQTPKGAKKCKALKALGYWNPEN